MRCECVILGLVCAEKIQTRSGKEGEIGALQNKRTTGKENRKKRSDKRSFEVSRDPLPISFFLCGGFAAAVAARRFYISRGFIVGKNLYACVEVAS